MFEWNILFWAILLPKWFVWSWNFAQSNYILSSMFYGTYKNGEQDKEKIKYIKTFVKDHFL